MAGHMNSKLLRDVIKIVRLLRYLRSKWHKPDTEDAWLRMLLKLAEKEWISK